MKKNYFQYKIIKIKSKIPDTSSLEKRTVIDYEFANERQIKEVYLQLLWDAFNGFDIFSFSGSGFAQTIANLV